MKSSPDFPFTTDGCSGGMTWAWQVLTGDDPPWQGLCVEHDRAYWAGGTWEQRKAADLALCRAVVAAGHPVWALLMLLSVRVGGSPFLPLPWRWAYGYQWPRKWRYDP